MSLETTDSSVQIPRPDPMASLASLNASVWFLGCGLGCATGLSIHCDLGKLHPLDCNSSTVDRTVACLNHHGVLAIPIYRARSYRNNGFDGCKFNTYNCACNLGHFWRDDNVATIRTRINASVICFFSSGYLRIKFGRRITYKGLNSAWWYRA